MTPEEFVGIINYVIVRRNALREQLQTFSNLVDRLEIFIDRADPIKLPLTQAEVDNAVSVYAQPYIDALLALETTLDELNTDVLH